MNTPNGNPIDPASAAALVARLLDEIDASDDELRELLLSDLLSAAWGGALAQSQ